MAFTFKKVSRCDFPAAKRGVATVSLSVCPLTLKRGCYLNILQKVFEFRATHFLFVIVQLLSTKIVHFYDKSTKLCQITTNP